MSEVVIHNQDCVTGMAEKLAPESVDLCVTSIPFGALFMYSGKPDDIGNNQDGIDLRAGQFGLHLRFFIEQLARVVKPGCNVCIHIQQLLRYKVQHGHMGRRDFRGSCIEMFTANGLFEWIGEVCIPKDPQIIAQRLSLHSLQFKTGRERNARKLAPAVNDYLLIFQKPGESEPVLAIHDRERNPNGWLTGSDWVRDAHGAWPVGYGGDDRALGWFEKIANGATDELLFHLFGGLWDDINETDILQNYKKGRQTDEEKHVCPLQLEVIRRLVRLYSNPGETVLDPFMGIASTAWVCVEQGRNAVGFELKESYHRLALKNVNIAKEKFKEQSLFS